jgi:superfamily II DNA/RNA helicase
MNNHYQRRNQYYHKPNNQNGWRLRNQPAIPSYNPMMFVRKMPVQEIQLNTYEPKNNFSDFNINSLLKENIFKKGYLKPTEIQDQAIQPLLDGRDVVGIASTGTGKTAAFLIPLINKILSDHSQKALIITPTRELAMQVEQEVRILARGTSIQSVICIGGENIGKQIRSLNNSPNFIVGTPGRLLDLGMRNKINFSSFKNIVLDEVDRMLDMGFVKDISFIISKLSDNRQSLFFSATLPKKAEDIARKFLKNPVVITLKTQTASENIDQDIVKIKGRNKPEVLLELLNKQELKKVLVFGRTKRGIEKLGKELNNRGVKAVVIHGNKSQGQRKRALEEFRNNKVSILLATDLASRGLDIDNITHVINYDLPQSYEDYIHRIGRTGRASRTGFALTFVD